MSYDQFNPIEYVAIQLKSPRRKTTVCSVHGDFNIDNPTDVCAEELLNILDNFGLSQHVTDPTLNKGHILDLVVSKRSSYF